MVCPFCGSIKTSVRNSRHTSRKNQVWRRRNCEECGRTFTTREKVELEFLEVLNEDGSSEPFLRSKLITSVIKACDHLPEAVDNAFALVETAEKKILLDVPAKSNRIEATEIFEAISSVLKLYEPLAHLKYLSYYSGQSLDKKDVREALKGR